MPSKLIQNIIVGIGAALLAVGLAWGIMSGIRAGKSDTILTQAENVTTGLRYFFTDNNRYPSAQEFQDKNLMLHYFSVYPLPSITGGGCTQTFAYTSSSIRTYELRFCLPKARGGFAKGWNAVKP
jgi:hypothetical protein